MFKSGDILEVTGLTSMPIIYEFCAYCDTLPDGYDCAVFYYPREGNTGTIMNSRNLWYIDGRRHVLLEMI